MSKSRHSLMSQLNLSPEKFATLCKTAGIADKSNYSDSELTQLLNAKPVFNAADLDYADPANHEAALSSFQSQVGGGIDKVGDVAFQITEVVQQQCSEVEDLASDFIADRVQSVIPNLLQKTEQKLQGFNPTGVSLGKSQQSFKSRLQHLRSSQSQAGALPHTNGNSLNGSNNN